MITVFFYIQGNKIWHQIEQSKQLTAGPSWTHQTCGFSEVLPRFQRCVFFWPGREFPMVASSFKPRSPFMHHKLVTSVSCFFHPLIKKYLHHHQLLFLSRSYDGVTDGYAVFVSLSFCWWLLLFSHPCKRPSLWWFWLLSCCSKQGSFYYCFFLTLKLSWKMLHLWLFLGWFGFI